MKSPTPGVGIRSGIFLISVGSSCGPSPTGVTSFTTSLISFFYYLAPGAAAASFSITFFLAYSLFSTTSFSSSCSTYFSLASTAFSLSSIFFSFSWTLATCSLAFSSGVFFGPGGGATLNGESVGSATISFCGTGWRLGLTASSISCSLGVKGSGSSGFGVGSGFSSGAGGAGAGGAAAGAGGGVTAGLPTSGGGTRAGVGSFFGTAGDDAGAVGSAGAAGVAGTGAGVAGSGGAGAGVLYFF